MKKIIFGCVICVLCLIVFLTIILNNASFPIGSSIVKEYCKEVKTSYGDSFTVEYKEYNFPDNSSSTELTDTKTELSVHFIDDTTQEWTYLEECYSDDKYNVYFFHESFIFVNDDEMIKVLKKDLYDNCNLNYTQYPKLIKEIILDGDQGITCLYAEFYLKENDEDIKKRICKIAEIPEHEDPTYYNTISDLKFKRYWHSEHGCEEVIDFSRKMVEKYKIRGSAI